MALVNGLLWIEDSKAKDEPVVAEVTACLGVVVYYNSLSRAVVGCLNILSAHVVSSSAYLYGAALDGFKM